MADKKRYEPSEAEPRWQEYWKKNKLYVYDEKSKKHIFSIDTPPPYASADHLHVGHAMHYSQFEFVARYKRMQGFNVFFPMGFDDNGLPTERFVEKKHKVNKKNISRADFIKLCLKETKISGETYHNLFSNLGFSVDWSLLYQTIDERSQRTAQASFIDLFKKGRLVRQDLPATWCMSCQTTIAQADFENVDMTSHFSDIVFKSGSKELVIATTRPELIPACVALCYHPTDKRYSALKGKFATVPITGHDVPIIADESADPEKGSGLMMVCTFGDKEDIEKWHKHKLELKIIFTEDGKINDTVPQYAGLRIREARKRILADLKESGELIAQKNISHAVNVHERCGTEVEFLKKPQWSVRVLDKKAEIIASGNKINWYPDHMRVRFEHWVENLNWEWGISRQRYYGVPFPVWYCQKCSMVNVPKIDELPVDPRENEPNNPCSCGSTEFIPEMDVMDTWMTSSVSPQINQHWTTSNERKGFMPMSLRPQAHDIIRTWAFYTIVKALYHNNDVPWTDIMISGHGQDPKGQKMSKSKGNVVTPNEVIKKFSSDALRYWAAGVKLGDDLPYMEKDILTGQKTVNKIFNASKFTLMHLEDFSGYTGDLEVLDRWLLSKLQQVIKEATDAFEVYEYSKTRLLVDKFFWSTFCDQYLEIVKGRLYNKEDFPEARASGQFALEETLKTVLKLFAPIMPHITEEVYQQYFSAKEKKKSIHVSSWPSFEGSLIDEKAEAVGDVVVQIVDAVRKFKSEKQMSLRDPIKKLVVTSEVDISAAEADLISVTKAKTFEHKKGPFKIEIE